MEMFSWKFYSQLLGVGEREEEKCTNHPAISLGPWENIKINDQGLYTEAVSSLGPVQTTWNESLFP